LSSWRSKQISPFTVFVTVLVTLGLAVALTMILATRRQPAERRGMLPFPESQLDYYQLDDVTGHLHRPDIRRWVDWPEHPEGGFELHTNNMGFREDAPTAIAKPPGTVRILVTGDSHTDGVLANSESFTSQLENLMNALEPPVVFETINGGHGHYGPQNFLGFLQRFLELKPDHFVVVFFVGNDLLDAVAEAWVRGQIDLPERPDRYMDRLRQAQELSSATVSQGLNQIYLLRTFPDLETRSLAITIDLFRQISSLSAEHGINVYTVLLPAKADVEPETDDDIAGAAEALELLPDDLELNRRLAATLAESLETLGIEVLDLYPTFDASPDELFWKRDHHLNVAGHRLMAELFVKRFGEQLRHPGVPEP
jgi:lysophospholipase L1-like esterase